MSTDFRDASGRHLEDADVLRNERRHANADHLYGVSAECSLKAVMVTLGLATKPDGAPEDRGYLVHMPGLWSAFQSFAQGRLASRYLEPLDHGNPFADWQIDQRYWSRTGILEGAAQAHRTAALQCRESLERQLLDGVDA
jgi:hypothetical protein